MWLQRTKLQQDVIAGFIVLFVAATLSHLTIYPALTVMEDLASMTIMLDTAGGGKSNLDVDRVILRDIEELRKQECKEGK